MILQLIVALFVAVLVSYYERTKYAKGFNPPLNVLGTFNFPYHFILLAICLATCIALQVAWAIPLWVLTEDFSYFIGNTEDPMTDKEWINFKLGGFPVLGLWVPWTYVGLAVLSVISYLIFA